MNNLNGLSQKFMSRMFRRVPNLVWDLMSGKLGIQTANGIFTLDITPGTQAQGTTPATEPTYGISVNPVDGFGVSLPAFATQVAHDAVKVGDLIISGNERTEPLGWVIDKKDVALVLLDTNGMKKNYTAPKVAIMGNTGALVVQSLTNLAGGEGMAGLQGSLLPLMMMGGDLDLDNVLPMMLLTQTQGAGAPAIQSMLPMLLMSGGLGKGGSGIDKMLPLMMLSGGLGGAPGAVGGMNPMLMAMLAMGKDDNSSNTGTGSSSPPRLTPIGKVGH